MRNSRAVFIALCLSHAAFGQVSYTWRQLKDKFEASNPALRAGQLNIAESKSMEITAFLRPNPGFTASLDQLDPFSPNPYRPLTYAFPSFSGSYLHEREHKRELRLESARKGTAIAQSQQDDLERNLIFNLRAGYVNVLQGKAILQVSKDNLDYYDKVLAISKEQFKAGDIAQVDLDRLELQRVQYEAELEMADVNLRTAKIQLLMMLDDQTPIDRFDVTGPFEFNPVLDSMATLRKIAMDARPDLRAAVQAIDKAKTDHQLAVSNGSTDPTFSVDVGRNPPIPAYFGFSVNIPVRIFDRNQGEKERTEIDIRRNERLRDQAVAQVFNDVDSAWVTVNSELNLLKPYRDKYLAQALRVRDTITFAYQHGGASLLDFLNAQNDYRSVQLNYLQLIGSYLTAAGQLNLAVGREVIQ
jgi:cobalt-zinc-cadmium efflux system outer membrane protein